MPQEKTRSQPTPLRCPFCHESVELESDAWVVCSGCLGRHHASCWDESGCCSSCQGTAFLKSDETSRASEQAGVRPQPTEDLIRLLDAHEHTSEGSVADYLLSPVTLGLYPLWVNEGRLMRHVEHNRDELHVAAAEDEDVRLKRYRFEALDETQQAAGRRRRVMATLLPAVLLTLFTGILIAEENLLGSSHASEDLGIALAVISALVWVVSTHVCLAFHWRAVRRHESKQLYHGLLQRGASEDEARQVLTEHQGTWSKFGSGGALITAILSFPSPLAFALPFWLAKMWSFPLGMHKKHEGQSPQLFPRRTVLKPPPESE